MKQFMANGASLMSDFMGISGNGLATSVPNYT